jgi:hypothetical protein
MAEETREEKRVVWFQQGDVTIKPVETIPNDAAPIAGRVLREGEATGHAHVATGEGVQLFMHGDTLYMRVPSGTEVVHEEHNAIMIPAGVYEVGAVREYDHFAEEARPVYD